MEGQKPKICMSVADYEQLSEGMADMVRYVQQSKAYTDYFVSFAKTCQE